MYVCLHVRVCLYVCMYVYVGVTLYVYHCICLQYAAHQLDKDAKQWENNAMVEAARKMAKLMMQMAKYTR